MNVRSHRERDADDGLLASGLVEEAQARIEAGCPERFDALLLSIAVKKLRLELAKSERRCAELLAQREGGRDELVARGRRVLEGLRPDRLAS
jgi:hypothetical protein